MNVCKLLTHYTLFCIFLQLSGVQVQPVCAEVFTKIKLGHQFRYVVYSLTNDLREITVLKTAQPGKLSTDDVNLKAFVIVADFKFAKSKCSPRPSLATNVTVSGIL